MPRCFRDIIFSFGIKIENQSLQRKVVGINCCFLISLHRAIPTNRKCLCHLVKKIKITLNNGGQNDFSHRFLCSTCLRPWIPTVVFISMFFLYVTSIWLFSPRAISLHCEKNQTHSKIVPCCTISYI